MVDYCTRKGLKVIETRTDYRLRARDEPAV